MTNKSPPLKTKGLFFLDDWFFFYVYRIGYYAWALPRDSLQFVLAKEDSSSFNAELIEKAYHDLKAFGKPGIEAALRRAYGWKYAFIGIYKFMWAVFTWASAWYFLKQTLLYISLKQSPFVGHMWSLALFLGSILSSICIHQLYSQCNRVSVQVRAAVSSMIYRKSLRLSRVRGGAGEVINILSSDLQRIVECVANFHFLWGAVVESVAIIIIAFVEIGVSAIPCLLFVLVLLPLQIYLAQLTSESNRQQTITTTERVHIMSEILTAIKLIKFYAWEKPFRNKIDKIREIEIGCIYKAMMVKTINFAIVFSVPVLIALFSLLMYVRTGHVLTAPVAFAVLSVYNTLRYPFFMLPMSVKSYASAKIAADRIDVFMALEEVSELKIIESNESTNPENLAFEIKNADFRWDGSDDDKPTIKDISFKAKKGSKIGIIGDVGSGKSSLICALLGQIRLLTGEMKLFASTSYVPQEAWLLNATLRDNILFGKEYNKRKYNEVIRVAGLQRDLTLLLAGDKTEIAERGANLSGGQRQRTSVARAVHYDADIVLMDDPLSAVDQHVGSHIFNECMMGYLKNKTVLMAIHQLQYLEKLDWIVMMHEGRIECQGTFQDMMKYDKFKEMIARHVDSSEVEEGTDNELEVTNDVNFEVPEVHEPELKRPRSGVATPDYVNTIRSYHIENELSMRKMNTVNELTVASMIERRQLSPIIRLGGHRDVNATIQQNELSVLSMSNVPDDGTGEDIAETKGKLITEDKSADDSLGHCIAVYANAYNGSLIFTCSCIFFFLVHGIRIGSDYWLRLWVPRVGGFSDAVYLGVYGACVALFGFGAFLRGWFLSYLNVKKSEELHGKLFHSVMRAPMSLFDSTPVGRILAAFSKHQLHCDDTMPDALFQFLQYCPLGLGALLLCAAVVPLNYIPMLVVMFLAGLTIYFSGRAENKTKALEAITRPHLFAHVTCTLEGLFSIRAFHANERFDKMNLEVLDANHCNLMAMYMVKSWIALNLDILSSIFVYFTALLIVLHPGIADRASVAGLALSNALQMLVFVQWTVRMLGDVISQTSSIGQIDYYGTKIPPEAPENIPETDPGEKWPSRGLIKFENIFLRYTPNGVDVLKNVNLKIYPTEKIGIVGRTGSGKSTLLVSLLRIVEAASGKVTIDDVDVKTLGLEELRSKIAIIPQEPVLFKGTIRSNLDPFNRSSDDQIWKALEAVYLHKKIGSLPDKLESAVIENGKNFSLGQRQLFCIARAILSRTKVLVLDEATANVSPETDLLIQKAIRENFKDLTVLTIAHRLNTIIDSTRVLVMDAGKVVEFDEPLTLLQREKGSFRSLVDQTGPATSKRLHELAEEAHKVNADVRALYENDDKNHGDFTIQEFAASKK